MADDTVPEKYESKANDKMTNPCRLNRMTTTTTTTIAQKAKPLLWPLEDPQAIVDLIAQVSDSTPETVAPRLVREFESPGCNVHQALTQRGIPFHVMTPGMTNFYETSDAFLYETSVSNHAAWKSNLQRFMLQMLAKYKKNSTTTTTTTHQKPCKVFCFGDGMGFDSALLASHGYDVSYHEPGKMSNQYAKQLFAKNQVTVHMIPSLEVIPDHSLDAIICFDVLEHCQDPWTVVELFTKWLKPDGLLLSNAPFWMVIPEVPTHLLSNKRYTANLARVYPGFTPVDTAFGLSPILLQKTNGGTIQRSFLMWLRIKLNQVLMWPTTTFLIIGYFWYVRFIVLPHDPNIVRMFKSYSDSICGKGKSE